MIERLDTMTTRTNAERQRDFRRERRRTHDRLTLFLPKSAAADFRALAESRKVTQSELLAFLIRQERDAQAGQMVIHS